MSSLNYNVYVSFQVDKKCDSPVTSSCQTSFRSASIPSSLPLVSQGTVCLRVVFTEHIYCTLEDHEVPLCLRSYRNSLLSCYTIPPLQVVFISVYMCTAGFFWRLFWPWRSRAEETTEDDGEQQLWLPDSRLWQNKWCVLPPTLIHWARSLWLRQGLDSTYLHWSQKTFNSLALWLLLP